MKEFLRDRFVIALPSILLLVVGIRQGEVLVTAFAITWIVFWLMGALENESKVER